MNRKRTNILILKGVFPEHLIQGDFFKKDKPTVMNVYTVIPKRFTGVENWPKSSNLHCWNCDQLFPDYPKFVASNPDYDSKEFSCDTESTNFCTWNCAAKYIDTKYTSKEQKWDLLRLLCLVASKFTGKYVEKIMPAPDKTIMRQYCGDHGLTPKEYRERINLLNTTYEISGYQLDSFKDR